MTQDKQLLLKDLCGRLPYGVKGKTLGGKVCTLKYMGIDGDFTADTYHGWVGREQFIPFLRPMSSMTEEEKKELKFMCDIGPETLTDSSWINGEFGLSVVYKNKASICVDVIDWLNKKMFDFRGLIPKGLAKSTEEFNPYKT